MGRIESISERALELASSVGDNMRHALPRAGQLLDAGAKLGVVKSGARVAATFVRRNPAVIAAAVAGAGLLWYAAHRRAKRAEHGNGKQGETIEGSARRVEAKRASGDGSRRSRSSRSGGSRSGSRSQRSAET
ncbi:hypothetical protein [Lysobacter sp. Root494]|uniref:hypothetical protein n=1 Tax=Lysobacter sp. Root494 TaxID=1736549 RepID=UPI0006FF2E1B|nr:hypothetical protein [Lysobacter sp. Root494]KQY49305.1 hypothetical protein ASD14_14645 [Lysobacter sp. Root494]